MPHLLGGMIVLRGKFADGTPFQAIPNNARNNRGRSIVWVRDSEPRRETCRPADNERPVSLRALLRGGFVLWDFDFHVAQELAGHNVSR